MINVDIRLNLDFGMRLSEVWRMASYAVRVPPHADINMQLLKYHNTLSLRHKLYRYVNLNSKKNNKKI